MLLADTGPLVAGANSRDRHHQASRDLLLNHPGPLLVPAPVVVEVCQLLASRQGADAEAAFLTTLGTDALTVVDLEAADYTRAAALVQQYADLPLGAVDACVIAVAERLRLSEIATLDRRHFTVVKPSTRSHCCQSFPSHPLCRGRAAARRPRPGRLPGFVAVRWQTPHRDQHQQRAASPAARHGGVDRVRDTGRCGSERRRASTPEFDLYRRRSGRRRPEGTGWMPSRSYN
jgi:uncharacterized protein